MNEKSDTLRLIMVCDFKTYEWFWQHVELHENAKKYSRTFQNRPRYHITMILCAFFEREYRWNLTSIKCQCDYKMFLTICNIVNLKNSYSILLPPELMEPSGHIAQQINWHFCLRIFRLERFVMYFAIIVITVSRKA